MKNHPLFNDATDDSPTSVDRAKREIVFINIQQILPGNKRITLTNQWEAEQLLTPLDVFEAVGSMEGEYELKARGERNQIVDSMRLNVRAPIGWKPPIGHPLYGKENQPQAPPAPAPAPTGPATAVPMQAGGLIIPANMDPMMAMIVSMMALNSQRDQAASAQQMQMAQFQMQQMVAMNAASGQQIISSNANMTNLIGTLATAFAPVFANRGGVVGSESGAETGFVKGIEIMAALKEGVDSASKAGQTDWAVFAQHVAAGIKGLADVAKATAPVAAPAGPVVPPGGPT
jgi:hypothetical protein